MSDELDERQAEQQLARERLAIHVDSYGRGAERARSDRTRRLLQITDVALAALPLDELLRELLARVCAALPADSAALLLTESPSDAFVLRATHGIAAAERFAPLPSGQGLAARVARARRPVALLGDEVAEVRLTPLREMGAVAGAPLLAAGRVVGVLEVGRRDAAPLGEDELALLQLAADRSALAVEHGRVFERERHIAHTLQQSLLPERLPDIPGVALEARYRPAGEGFDVGGDFYDAFPLTANRWLLTIGDVCGKGPEAAALTALVRYTIRAEATHDPCPGQLLRRLNQAILAQRSDLRFCTALCLLLDLSGGRAQLTVASGGHPMPLIARASGTVETPWTPGGPLVGAYPDAHYEQQHCRLDIGDTLLAYTDGLLDAHAPDRALDPDDLAAAARGCPKNPLAAFVRELEHAAIGNLNTPARDDIAILALSRHRAPNSSRHPPDHSRHRIAAPRPARRDPASLA